MGGGAWPFLVGGVICLVNSDNERDSSLLNSLLVHDGRYNFLEGYVALSHMRESNNRSVMPLDVRGCTRATLKESASTYPGLAKLGNLMKLFRARDWGLQLLPMNEEFPVSMSHQLVLITSLPFVHTARRYYRLNGLVRTSDLSQQGGSPPGWCAEKTVELDHLEEVKVVTRFP